MRQLQVGSRIPRAVLPWLAACVLLTIGVLSALVTLMGVPKTELARAASSAQHLTIDPATGEVTGLTQEAARADTSTAAGHDAPTPEAAAAAIEKTTSATTEATASTTEPPASESAEKPAAETPAETAPAPVKSSDPNAADQLMPTPANAPMLATSSAVKSLPAIAPGNESIVSPPAKEITEEKNGLLLPKIGEGGASPATLYAKKVAEKSEMARVSIVIIDAGFNAQSIATILKLPKTVTIAVSPYAPDVAKNIILLHVAGYETWAMLPTIGAKYPSNDPGPLGLIPSLPPEELSRRVQASMSTTLGSVGFILPVDESFSEHEKIFAATLKSIADRGLLTLSTHPTRTVTSLTGKNKQLEPFVKRADIVLDAKASPIEIQSKLDGVQASLMNKTNMIIVVPARLNILNVLAEWLAANGLGASAQIMPLSAMYPKEAVVVTESEPKEEGGGEAKKASFEKASGAKPKYNQSPKKINDVQH